MQPGFISEVKRGISVEQQQVPDGLGGCQRFKGQIGRALAPLAPDYVDRLAAPALDQARAERDVVL